MTHYIEDSDFRSEYDEIFNDWYEIEGIRKIKELSRQLRTFFNYKVFKSKCLELTDNAREEIKEKIAIYFSRPADED